MVEVFPPEGWEPPGEPEPTPEAASPAIAKKPPQPQTREPAANEQPDEINTSVSLDDAPIRSPDAEVEEHTQPSSDPEEVDEEEQRRAATVLAMSPVGLAPAELLWRKWLLLAAAPVAGVVIAVTAWGLISSRNRPETPSPAPVAPPVEPAPLVEQPDPPEEDLDLRATRLDPRWLPDETRLVVSLRTSRLADRDEFNLALPLAGDAWATVAGELLRAFGLKIETIRRLTWASTDLAAWPDYGVIVVELEEGQDAGVFRPISEPTDIVLDGEPCRRLEKDRWPHPFAVLDKSTIVTGREELLGELAKRSEPHLESAAIERLVAASSPNADVVALVDLTAAREADWQLPTPLLDIWPPGREAWHVAWELPRALAFCFCVGPPATTEIALSCEGETAAKRVQAALDELVPAGKTVIGSQVESLGAKLQAGRLTAASAGRYEAFLTGAGTALDAAEWKVEEETVWLKIAWGEDVSSLFAAMLESRPAIRAEWLDAARVPDEANHRRLLAGLEGYQRAEGHFPAGAGGGAMLPPETRLSWIATMLPYYGHRDWHGELDFRYPWNSPRNRSVSQRRLELVINPALGPSTTEAGFPVTHYVGVAGVGPDAGKLKAGHPRAGLFGFGRTTRLSDIPDGASTTIAILGVTERLGAWAVGGNATVRPLTKPPYVNGPDGFGSGQPNGMMAGMADGSVRFLSSRIDPTVMEQLATVAGGETVPPALLEPADTPKPPPTPEEKPAPVEPDDEPQPAPAPEAPAVGPSAEAVGVDVEARLADPVVDISFPDVPLVEAVGLLAQMSTLPITFDPIALAEMDVTVRDRITVKVADATVGEILEAVLARRGLAYVVEDDHILVTSPEEKRNALRTVRYSVSDLTGAEPASVTALARLVEEMVVPESWRGAGGRGTVEPDGGALSVVQADPVQHQVLTFCEKLRVARGIPVRSRRDPGQFALATRSDRARAKLDAPITINFHEPAPLVRIASELETLSGTTLLIDWLAIEAGRPWSEVTGSLTADGEPLSEALDNLLQPLGLTYRVIDGETLEITARNVITARLEVEFHPLGDLITEATTAGSLVGRIEDQVAGATWSDAGGPGILRFDEPSKCLIVLQSQAVQFELEALLGRWREEKPTTP